MPKPIEDRDNTMLRALGAMVDSINRLEKLQKTKNNRWRAPSEDGEYAGMRFVKTPPVFTRLLKGIPNIDKILRGTIKTITVFDKIIRGTATAFKIASKAVMGIAGVIGLVIGILAVPLRKLRWAIESTQEAMKDLGVIGIKNVTEGVNRIIDGMSRGMGKEAAKSVAIGMQGILKMSGVGDQLKSTLQDWFLVTDAQTDATRALVEGLSRAGLGPDGIAETMRSLSSKLMDSGVNVNNAIELIASGLKNQVLNVQDIDKVLKVLAAGGPEGAGIIQNTLEALLSAKRFEFSKAISLIEGGLGGLNEAVFSGDLEGIVNRLHYLSEDQLYAVADAMNTNIDSLKSIRDNYHRLDLDSKKTWAEMRDMSFTYMTLGEKVSRLLDILLAPALELFHDILLGQNGFDGLRIEMGKFGTSLRDFLKDHWKSWVEKMPSLWTLLEKGVLSFVTGISVAMAKFGANMGEELYDYGKRTRDRRYTEMGMRIMGVEPFFLFKDKDRDMARQARLQELIKDEYKFLFGDDWWEPHPLLPKSIEDQLIDKVMDRILASPAVPLRYGGPMVLSTTPSWVDPLTSPMVDSLVYDIPTDSYELVATDSLPTPMVDSLVYDIPTDPFALTTGPMKTNLQGNLSLTSDGGLYLGSIAIQGVGIVPKP